MRKAAFLFAANMKLQQAIQKGFDQITTDGIHLTRYGHELLATLLYEVIIKEFH